MGCGREVSKGGGREVRKGGVDSSEVMKEGRQ